MQQKDPIPTVPVSPAPEYATPQPEQVMPGTPTDVGNLDGFIQTLEFVPTYKPQRFLDQFVIVSAGGSSRAYWYDTKPSSLGWKYAALT